MNTIWCAACGLVFTSLSKNHQCPQAKQAIFWVSQSDIFTRGARLSCLVCAPHRRLKWSSAALATVGAARFRVYFAAAFREIIANQRDERSTPRLLLPGQDMWLDQCIIQLTDLPASSSNWNSHRQQSYKKIALRVGHPNCITYVALRNEGLLMTICGP